MFTLVSFNGAAPELLPARIRLPDGSTRTGLDELPQDELAAVLAQVGGVIVPPRLPNQTWDAGAWRDETAEELEQHRLDRLAFQIRMIKEEAGSRILSRYPQYKQHNMNKRANQLNDIRLGSGIEPPRSLTEAEETEAETLRAAGRWIDSIRDASNAIEAKIANYTTAQLDLYLAAEDPDWPV